VYDKIPLKLVASPKLCEIKKNYTENHRGSQRDTEKNALKTCIPKPYSQTSNLSSKELQTNTNLITLLNFPHDCKGK